ncbi:glycosyltransferase family 4 protein [Cohnella candidum]|uniref:Glycosyltransferase n=1 Tax=Cohnella candidum TaxID=2674991 RepID=A0A3G3K122_9BACL|nr:glycosyltransferase family 4 protein [Cohnella candidum]AYQ73851.1 glycosyltransferase [Cohnella candidum]
MAVYMLPKKLEGNKYIELLVESLERRDLPVKSFNREAVVRIGRGDVFHIHWPSYYYTGKNAAMTAAKSALFVLLLVYLRLRGAKIVWTVHNVWPHQTGETGWNRFMRKLLCRFCSRLIVMGDSVKAELVRHFKADESKIVRVPHGHYGGVYGSKGTNVRARFGIPEEDYLFLFVGQISPYKGLDHLVPSFKRMRDRHTHLLIAGKPSSDFDRSLLADCGEGVHLHLDFVPDEELADYVRGADAVVLPYRKITTSGTAILAASYCRPVVAPDLGLLKDYLTPDIAILYDPGKPDALAAAMAEIKERRDEFRSEDRYARILRDLDWHSVSRTMLDVYGTPAQVMTCP